MSKQFSYDDDPRRALTEIHGIFSSYARSVSKSRLSMRQSQGLGKLYTQSNAMLSMWQGLPERLCGLMQEIRSEADSLLMRAACSACDVDDTYDLPDSWENESVETADVVPAIKQLAGKLFEAQEIVMADFSQHSSYNEHIAKVARRTDIVIDGLKLTLEQDALPKPTHPPPTRKRLSLPM